MGRGDGVREEDARSGRKEQWVLPPGALELVEGHESQWAQV